MNIEQIAGIRQRYRKVKGILKSDFDVLLAALDELICERDSLKARVESCPVNGDMDKCNAMQNINNCLAAKNIEYWENRAVALERALNGSYWACNKETKHLTV